MVGTGRYELDPNAAIDALFNCEFVHMSEVEEIVIQRDNAVADAVASAPPDERMRSKPLSSESWLGRWTQMFSHVTVLLNVAGGVKGFTNFIVNLVVRSLDRSHRGRNDREVLDEETFMRGMLGNPRVRARLMK